MWLKPQAIARKSKRRGRGGAEDPLLAFPSEHTCLVCNVVAVADLLTNASSSRFVAAGIPPVYLACAINMDRDDVDGTIHTLEPAIREHQELCEEEASKFAEVREGEQAYSYLVVYSACQTDSICVSIALDPGCGADWLAFFTREFHLLSLFELWRGDEYVRVQETETCHTHGPRKLPLEKPTCLSCLPVYSVRAGNYLFSPYGSV
jgi:hypothetical protein